MFLFLPACTSSPCCLQCCSFNCCGLGPIQSIVLAGLNCIWWLVAASILTAAAVAADGARLPASDARHMIIAAAWCAAVAELVHSIVACLVVGNNVCNILFCVEAVPGDEECCGGCCCCARGRHRHRHGTHQPLLPSSSPAAAAAAAAATGALLNRSWWQRQQQRRPIGQQQQQQRPVTVVTVQQGVTGGGPAAGSYMVRLRALLLL